MKRNEAIAVLHSHADAVKACGALSLFLFGSAAQDRARPSIAAIGNVLRDKYRTISDKVVWNAVYHDVPSLKAAPEAMAANQTI